ncbi:MAG TPA: hypothetical protein VN025_03575 [Candidatus Dormibacteraeota bacterium]|jgi:hypothetical protein|nr:hypothetical protein [Candidatus Dormibacteraeota bacterium]
MRKTMRLGSIALASAITGALFLGVTPTVSAQRIRHRVVFVEPGPFFYGPFFPYDYYYYPPRYAANYGEVKIEAHHQQKDSNVYIDGGFAANLKDHNKFGLRPGNHEIELRNYDGQTIYQERVAVTIGQTTKLHVS